MCYSTFFEPVFSMKALIEDTNVTFLKATKQPFNGWSSEPDEGVAVCSLKEVPLFFPFIFQDPGY